MFVHKSVLLEEAIQGLNIKPDGIYIDGTFGRGGHSAAILKELNRNGRLISIDKDQAAVEHAEKNFEPDERFSIIQASFATLAAIVQERNLQGNIDGVLLDLGVSSPQIDDPARGFSFMQAGPLDMRMDLQQDMDAAYFIQHASIDEMAEVFRSYGEERFSGRIARAIAAARLESPIKTTAMLAEIVKQANPQWEKHKHPATRVFQALRIYVNQELTDLVAGLKQSIDVLAVGGRLVVISFHSLEDRIVKQWMLEMERGDEPPVGVPIRASEIKSTFKRIGRAIKPTENEIKNNIRARSAILRIGEKIA